MERIITLKVDLEYPDEAHHAIDEAVKVYEEDKLKWTEEEIAKAKNLAMKIMTQLCLDGYGISWYGNGFYLSVFLESEDGKKMDSTCFISHIIWNLWIVKCVCLCRATGREVPTFIIKKAGECW